MQYSVALENPPLLITSDMDRIVIHTTGPTPCRRVHEFATDDLLDGAVRDRLKAAFTDPDEFKPSKTRRNSDRGNRRRVRGTSATAARSGHEAHEVAHFINRLVFCMFAEDVGLLPDHLFTKMLRASQIRPERFETNARKLFAAMAKGGDIDFEPIEWFISGLFDSDHALPVTSRTSRNCFRPRAATGRRSILRSSGTLFERGLDPAKRRPARRALHGPRQDHADRAADDHRAARKRNGPRRWRR